MSTGEVLSTFSDARLNELRGDANKLARNLGRTAHYERKNRSNIECVEADVRLVEAEIVRRRWLTTLTMCGVVWHWNDTGFRFEGEYATKNDVPLRLHRWVVTMLKKPTGEFAHFCVRHPVYEFVREAVNARRYLKPDRQSFSLTAYELQEARRRGAKVSRLTDPLASPWKVADFDTDDAPWLVGEDDGR